jgi:hypothetical protein
MLLALPRILLLVCLATSLPAAHAQLRAEPLGGAASRAAVHIDARLDEDVWQRAPIDDRFQQQDPYTGKPAPFRTTVQVAHDKRALYFAIHAYDPRPQDIRAPRVRYDKVLRDQDFVVIFIDGLGTRAAAQWFRIGAGGSIADGVYTAATDNEDFSPDFTWDAAARIVDDGYVVEARIPFSTLRFAHDGTLPWRVQVARRMPREQLFLFLNAPLTRESPSFIAEARPLEGFTGPSTEFFWQATPIITARRLTEEPDDPATRRNDLEAGLDLKVPRVVSQQQRVGDEPALSRGERGVSQRQRLSGPERLSAHCGLDQPPVSIQRYVLQRSVALLRPRARADPPRRHHDHR